MVPSVDCIILTALLNLTTYILLYVDKSKPIKVAIASGPAGPVLARLLFRKYIYIGKN